MAGKKNSAPEWVRRILLLRKQLGLNQSELATRLNYSAMALSRWESGTHEPTSQAYLQLGNLADGQESIWFWTRAGMKSADLSRMAPEGESVLHKADLPDFEIVVAGSGVKRGTAPKVKAKLVAIPVLSVHAGSHGEKGDQVLDLDQAEVAEMIAAPALWCPNPAETNCLRVRGSSMSPMIDDGDIVVVDCSAQDVNGLNGNIIVAWNRKTGLTLSRFLV